MGEIRNQEDLELPPRARRILLGGAAAAGGAGTTSACAENTVCAGSILPTTGNYLRVRGEYLRLYRSCGYGRELPPRARRIPPVVFQPVVGDGTTSACAENTYQNKNGETAHRNYLRVRGEYMGFWSHLGG